MQKHELLIDCINGLLADNDMPQSEYILKASTLLQHARAAIRHQQALEDHLCAAWTLIGNAGFPESPFWQEAAIKWRDKWHALGQDATALNAHGERLRATVDRMNDAHDTLESLRAAKK